MTRQRRKWFSVLIAVAMIIGMLPIMAFAEEVSLYPLEGFVYDDEGDPIAGIVVGLYVEDTQVDSSNTNSEGKYSFRAPAGTYTVKQDLGNNWRQISPDEEYVVTLPNRSMIYGIQRSTGKIFEVNPKLPVEATLYKQIDSLLLNRAFTSTSPNGLAFDLETGELYFATYPVPSRLYKITESEQLDLGPLVGSVASGEFYNGKYYYIADQTDDLYEVSFKPDGTIDVIEPHLDISNNTSAWYFGDIVVDHLEGVIYGEGGNKNTVDQEFFKVNLDGSGYAKIKAYKGNLLQLAIGTDNTLYAHSAFTGDFYTIERTTGDIETISDGANLYTDISSASTFFNFIIEPVPPSYSISGTKYEDFYTGANSRETLSDWTIYLFDREIPEGVVPSESNEGLIAQTITDSNGHYSFTNLFAGTYYIYEMVEDCYAQYLPVTKFHTVTLEGDTLVVANKDFVNRRGVIQGKKVNFNGEGSIDPDAGLEGWTIYLFDRQLNADEIPNRNLPGYLADTTTVSGGSYQFFELCPGTYYIYEEVREGWVQTKPTAGFYKVDLVAGDRSTGNIFGNMEEEFYNICGYKYEEGTEIGLEGWTITLEQKIDGVWVYAGETTTDENGKYCYEDLVAGEYRLSESVAEKVDGFWVYDSKLWKKVGNEFIDVTLPKDASDSDDEDTFHNFYNQCYTNETAWAKGDIELNTLPGMSNNWGWSNTLVAGFEGSYPLYAAAGQNDLDKGVLVGYANVSRSSSNVVSCEIDIFDGIELDEQHVWIGNTALPLTNKGVITNAPGKFLTQTSINWANPVYIAIHLSVYVPCE